CRSAYSERLDAGAMPTDRWERLGSDCVIWTVTRRRVRISSDESGAEHSVGCRAFLDCRGQILHRAHHGEPRRLEVLPALIRVSLLGPLRRLAVVAVDHPLPPFRCPEHARRGPRMTSTGTAYRSHGALSPASIASGRGRSEPFSKKPTYAVFGTVPSTGVTRCWSNGDMRKMTASPGPVL